MSYYKHLEKTVDKHSVTFTGPYLNEPDTSHTVFVTLNEFIRYVKGAAIQEAFPLLSPDDREFLMTGISPTAWEEMIDASMN